jgi:hypothetical protein
MKSYLCLEKDKEAFSPKGVAFETKTRPAVYFVLEAKNMREAKKKTKALGAETVRPLTEEEAASKTEDGSYDIEL